MLLDNKNTIAIVFAPGAYGHFIQWCILYFSGKIDQLPFLEDGSSHGLRETVTDLSIERIHPRNVNDANKPDVVPVNLDIIANSYNKVILLYANYDSFLLNIHNKFNKLIIDPHNGWLRRAEALDPEMANNIKKFNVNNLFEMRPWQLREFLSYYMWAQHQAETEIENILNFNNNNIIKIDIRQLVDNFQTTIKTVLNFCELAVVRTNFDEIYNIWIKLQKHVNKDQIVLDIVNSVINDVNIDWSDKSLTILDESIVQFKLREIHNLDLLCNDLDQFPTNTNDLKQLLINMEK